MDSRDRMVCAVDVGSSTVKAAVYDRWLRLRAEAHAPFPARMAGGRAEADLPEVWQVVAAVIRDTVDGSGVEPTVVAMTTQMAGLALLDNDDRPLGRYILGVDRRAASHHGGGAVAVARTGCPPGNIHPVDKLAWLAQHEPGRLAAAHTIGGLKDFLLHQLCGVWVTDPSSASATGLYDQLAQRWWPDAARRVGVEVSMLPEIVPADHLVGTVTVDAAHACGLPPGVPVIAGLGDGPAANLAVGALSPHQLCLSLGTTVVARLFVPEPDLPEVGVSLFRHRVGSRTFCVGCRFDQDRRMDGAYTLVGRPGHVYDQAEIPGLLRGFLDRYAVRELRPSGSRSHQPGAAAALEAQWKLPVRLTGARDGTRGVARLALGDVSL